MNIDLRWLLTFFGNCVFIFVIQLVNDTIGTQTIFLYLNGLAIFAPLLFYPIHTGLLCTMLTGVVVDVFQLTPFGLSPFLFALTFTTCYSYRNHFKGNTSFHDTLIIQVSNAALFLTLNLLLNTSNIIFFSFWLSLFVNLIISQLVLIFITPWFLNFHTFVYNLISPPVIENKSHR